MGAARKSKNILLSLKWKEYRRAWYLIRHFDKITYEDTFMPMVCKIKGHKPYQPDPKWEPDDWACKRCHRFIDFKPRLEKLKRLKKISK